MKIAIDQILVGDRQREDPGDVAALAASIKKFGLFHPIVIDQDNHLVAGFRRISAHMILGEKEIEYRRFAELDPLGRLQIELEENIQRKDLSWREIAKTRKTLHALYVTLHDTPREKWTLDRSAEIMGISKGTLSEAISLSDAAEAAPEEFDTESQTEARRRLRRSKEHDILQEMARRKKDRSTNNLVLLPGDAVELIKSIPDKTVNVIFFDPPWGAGAGAESKINRAHDDTFDDDPVKALTLMNRLIPELYRVCTDPGFLFTFFAIDFYDQIISTLRNVGFEVPPVPNIWVKNGVGMTDFSRYYGPQYEMFLHCRKGDRTLESAHSQIFTHDRVPGKFKIHATEKPMSLYLEILRTCAKPGEIVLDPCMGSGAAIRAAIKFGCIAVGFELDEEMLKKAQAAMFIEDIPLKGDE